MVTDSNCACSPSTVGHRDRWIAGGLTLGAALVVAGIMLIGKSELTETIGLVMFPGVLGVGAQWIYLRGRSRGVKAALIGGTFLVLFLIGLVAGLVAGD